MNLLRPVYENSPIWFQNIMTTVYGLDLLHKRRHSNFQQVLNEITESQWLSKDEMLELQRRKLVDILMLADKNIPYYNRTFKEFGFKHSLETQLDDIRKLPIITRDDIYQHGEEMVNRNDWKRDCFKDYTSGTTSTPLTIYTNIQHVNFVFAFWERFRNWAGVAHGMKRATFGGRIIIPIKQKGQPVWRYNWSCKQILFSSFHISRENTPYIAERFNKFKPEYIDGYVSSPLSFAKIANELGIKLHSPKAILTTSETLFDWQRKILEETFNCKVYNQYGHGEGAVFISECEKGGLHINTEFGVVEILDDNNEPVKPGELGRIIATGFGNRIMPLIRYDTSDVAISSDRVCPCGRNGLPVVERVEGRVLDIMTTPTGRKIRLSSLVMLFDKPNKPDVQDVQEAQIIQDAKDHITVLVIPRGELKSEKQIISALKLVIGDEMIIEVKKVDHIKRTETGKFRFVVVTGDSVPITNHQ